MTTIHPDTTSLAALFRDGSQAEHTEAEGSSFMSEMLAGTVSRQGYADYLARLGRIYEALEEVGRELSTDPVASVVVDPVLERAASIAADQEHWGPGDAATPAVDAYVERIRASAGEPIRYIAHHYTRYLGDLSGGQAIGRLLKKTFELDDAGWAFYRFADIAKPKVYKDAYRARLDSLPLDEGTKLDGLAEVKRAFALNGSVFDELTRDLESYRR